MREFVTKGFLFLALQLLVCATLFFAGANDRSEDGHYLSSLIDKHERLNSMNKPRLIFVGGSNLMFGIDTQNIENEVGFETVNMGVNAALGLDYILADIETKVSADDLIVLSLEYEFFLKDLAQAPSVWHALGLAPHNIVGLGFSRVPWIMDNGLYPLRQLIRQPFTGKPLKEDLYTRDNVNEWGDIVNRPEKYNQEINAPSSMKQVNVSGNRSDSRVALFIERVSKKGAKVVVIYPFVPESYFNVRGDFYNSVHSALSENGFCILGTPAEATLEDKYFYDTNYHLTAEGANIRTKHIVSQLKPLVRSMAVRGR